jgi:hypothetical protein
VLARGNEGLKEVDDGATTECDTDDLR